MESEREKLAACPFCGHPVIMVQKNGLTEFLCAEVGTCRGTGLYNCFLTERAETAVAQWNRRAEAEALRARMAELEAALTAVQGFDMGVDWALGLRGQTLEDSRAVGRTLYSDTFSPIAAEIAQEIEAQGFDSFKTSDDGISQALRIIRAALTTDGGARG